MLNLHPKLVNECVTTAVCNSDALDKNMLVDILTMLDEALSCELVGHAPRVREALENTRDVVRSILLDEVMDEGEALAVVHRAIQACQLLLRDTASIKIDSEADSLEADTRCTSSRYGRRSANPAGFSLRTV